MLLYVFQKLLFVLAEFKIVAGGRFGVVERGFVGEVGRP